MNYINKKNNQNIIANEMISKNQINLKLSLRKENMFKRYLSSRISSIIYNDNKYLINKLLLNIQDENILNFKFDENVRIYINLNIEFYRFN
jgi:hypothetical protein